MGNNVNVEANLMDNALSLLLSVHAKILSTGKIGMKDGPYMLDKFYSSIRTMKVIVDTKSAAGSYDKDDVLRYNVVAFVQACKSLIAPIKEKLDNDNKLKEEKGYLWDRMMDSEYMLDMINNSALK